MYIQVNEINETKIISEIQILVQASLLPIILHLQPRKTALFSRAPFKKEETESEGHLETAKEKTESKIHRYANQGDRNMQIKQCQQEDHTLCIQKEAQVNGGSMFNRNNKTRREKDSKRGGQQPTVHPAFTAEAATREETN